MFRRSSSRGWRLVAVLVLLGAGCSQKVNLNPVTGKVLYQGEPLAGALVSLHPDASTSANATPPTGYTKPDGTFSVVTGEIEGALPGKYTVTVMCQIPVKTKTEGMSFGGEGETEDRLKGAYANRDTSQIKVTIKDGPNQLEPFDLK